MDLYRLKEFIEFYTLKGIDLRLEKLLAYYMTDGMELDDLLVRPKGVFKRPFSKDIDKMAIEPDGHSRDQLNIYLNREGLYDCLPEGLTHQPASREDLRSSVQINTEMGVQKERERAAREFFLPLEQEFFLQRFLLARKENNSYADAENPAEISSYREFWNIPDFFDLEQICCLIYLLPLAYRISTDLALAAVCFELVLGQHVTLQKISATPLLINAYHDVRHTYCLGTDFTVGESFTPLLPVIEITIGPVSTSEIATFLPETKKACIIEYLCDAFLPAEYDHIVNYKNARKDGTEGNSAVTYLGYDFTL